MLFIYFLPILGTNIFNSIFHLFNIQRFCQMSVHTHGNTLFSIFLECIIKIRWNICKSFVVCKIRKLFIPGVSVQKRHTFSFHLLLINHSSKKTLSDRQCTSFHATGCHFTGPVALRPRLSSGLPIVLFKLLNLCKKLILLYYGTLLYTRKTLPF